MPYRVTYTVNYGVPKFVKGKRITEYQSIRITRYYKYEGHARRWMPHWRTRIIYEARKFAGSYVIDRERGYIPIEKLLVGEEIIEVAERGVTEFVHEYH